MPDTQSTTPGAKRSLSQGQVHQLAIMQRNRRSNRWGYPDTETGRITRRLADLGYATIQTWRGLIRGDITDAGRAALAAHEQEACNG